MYIMIVKLVKNCLFYNFIKRKLAENATHGKLNPVKLNMNSDKET